MAKKMAFLEYAFLFEPTSTFTNLYEFEQTLADFFAAHGYAAEVLDSVDRAAGGRRVVYLTTLDKFTLDSHVNAPEKQVGIQGRLKQMKGKK